jgi:hypothetical protein
MSSPVQPERDDERSAPHVLIVRDVGEPYGPLSTDEFADFEVEHPGCPTFERWDGGTGYDCAVGQQDSIRWSMHYSGTPVTEPGRYLIESWCDSYYVWDYGCTEYDGGVVLVDEKETTSGNA